MSETSPTRGNAASAEAAARNTDSGPAVVPPGADTPAAAKAGDTQQMAAAMADNPTKPLEYGEDNGLAPSAGATSEAPSPSRSYRRRCRWQPGSRPSPRSSAPNSCP